MSSPPHGMGASPFVEARPSDGELRPDWWKLYNDPMLNKLKDQAMAANPDLQAAAERFVQARDVMMQVRSQWIPAIGLEPESHRQSAIHIDKLFRPTQHSDNRHRWTPLGASRPGSPISGRRSAMRRGWRSTAPRSAPLTRGLARLSLQAEIASNYFTLRGLDAQAAIYKQSIDLYKRVARPHQSPVRRRDRVGARRRPRRIFLFSTETK